METQDIAVYTNAFKITQTPSIIYFQFDSKLIVTSFTAKYS